MSSKAPRVDLRPDHWDIVRSVLRQHLPMRHVVAFGSRATWTAKEYSDLDLAVLGEESLALDTMAALADGFGESDLPFKVDVVVWASVDDHLRDLIRRDAVDVQAPGSGSDTRLAPSHSADRLHLSARHRRILEALLGEHLPDVEAWACGSRVGGRSHEGSDLDLVLRGPGLEEIPAKQLVQFEDAVRDSSIPFLVQVRDWAGLAERFRAGLEQRHDVLTPERPAADDPLFVSQSTSALASGERTSSLEEMCELIIDCPHFTPDWTDRGYVVIRNQNIRNGRLDLGNPSFTHKSDYTRRVKRAKPRAGDIVFTREAPMGEVCMLPEDVECCLGQRQVLLRPRSDVDGRYLFYALQSPFVRRQIFWNEGTGSTVSNVRIPVLKALRVPRLGAGERFAAECLGALDAKIDLIRHQDEALAGMAGALFKSWFVEFEPVRAKMAGRDAGLPSGMATLFPARMARVEAREAPSGWHRYQLTELAKHHTATTSPSAMPDTPFAHFSIPAYDNDRTPLLELGANIKSNKTLVPRGAVLLSKLNPDIPRVWLPDQSLDVRQICSTEFLAFTPLAAASRALLFCLFCDHAFRNMLRSLVTGTSKSHQRVPPKALKSQLVIAGTPAVLLAFAKLATPWLDQTIASRAEAQTLTELRDCLLPRLVSGEVPVADAERAVEAVT